MPDRLHILGREVRDGRLHESTLQAAIVIWHWKDRDKLVHVRTLSAYLLVVLRGSARAPRAVMRRPNSS